MDTLQRTISDISFELSKEVDSVADQLKQLPTISEVEDAKCECCGMCEECTPEYIARVREKFLGKLICGLCSEAVKEEMEKSGGKIEDALSEHTSVCVRFNQFDRTNPVLFQAAAMKEMLKKSSRLAMPSIPCTLRRVSSKVPSVCCWTSQVRRKMDSISIRTFNYETI